MVTHALLCGQDEEVFPRFTPEDTEKNTQSTQVFVSDYQAGASGSSVPLCQASTGNENVSPHTGMLEDIMRRRQLYSRKQPHQRQIHPKEIR